MNLLFIKVLLVLSLICETNDYQVSGVVLKKLASCNQAKHRLKIGTRLLRCINNLI